MKFTATLQSKQEIHTEYVIGENPVHQALPKVKTSFLGFYNTLELITNEIATANSEFKTGKQYIITIEEIK